MDLSIDDIVLQRPVIGVHPINIHNLHEAIDGGACKFQKTFVKTFYGEVGYYVAGVIFFHLNHLMEGIRYGLIILSSKKDWFIRYPFG